MRSIMTEPTLLVGEIIVERPSHKERARPVGRPRGKMESPRVESWPRRVEIACWYCCHGFDTVPIPLPVAYDERRNVFSTMGWFCSFDCCKSFNLERNSVNRDRCCTLLSLFRSKIRAKELGRAPLSASTASAYGIRGAPVRRKLAMFGGPLSIEEFRRGAEVLVSESDGEALANISEHTEREEKVVFDETLGIGSRTREVLEGKAHEEDSSELFRRLREGGEPAPVEKAKAKGRRGRTIRSEQQSLDLIRTGGQKNVPYKIRRDAPVRENATLLDQLR